MVGVEVVETLLVPVRDEGGGDELHDVEEKNVTATKGAAESRW